VRLPQNPVLIVFSVILICIVLSALGLLFPLLLGGVGYWLYANRSKKAGVVLMAVGFFLVLQVMFHVDAAGVLIGALFFYIGYRLIKSQSKKEPDAYEKDAGPFGWQEQEPMQEKERLRWSMPSFGGSPVGNLRLLNRQFHLDGLTASYGICDVKIDLSKAIIPEGETTLVISSLIGDVDIYVPYDLDVSVSTSVTAGSLEVLGLEQNGINNRMNVTSPGYETAARKVKISISILLGDVDVRYL
jgi:lia operon protein LiaF